MRGDLIAGEGRGDTPDYYRISPPDSLPSADAAAQIAAERDKQERRARKDAQRARWDVLVAHAGERPKAQVHRELTTLCLLTGNGLHSNVTHFCRILAQQIGLGPDIEAAGSDWDWRGQAATHRDAEQLAFLVALVSCEVAIRDQYLSHDGDPAVACYRRWLSAHGHGESEDAGQPGEGA